MPKTSNDSSLTLQSVALTAALALLATLAGIMAGGSWVLLVLLTAAIVGLGQWAVRRDWLVRAEEDALAGRRLRDAAVVAVSAVFAVLYVALTGGRNSPLSFALYLPLVLAAICFGTRAGLAAGLGMGFLYIVGLGWRDPSRLLASTDWEAVISFPLVAVCVSLLSKRNEERTRALRSEARDSRTLLDMSQMMDAAYDLDMTLNLILLNIQKLCSCQVCAVYLKDVSGESLELRAVSGPRGRAPLLPSLSLQDARAWDGRGQEWRLAMDARTGQRTTAFYAEDVRSLSQSCANGLCALDPRTSSFACLPLTNMDGLRGMLYVGCDLPDGLRPDEVALLEQLADRAAFALQRVLLQQDFQTLAYTDAMTGLDNFRQFERTLHDELPRAERYDRPLSLLLLDIDHFKQFNDTLGHPAGDALLGQLGTVLRNTLRAVDKPARYGGEEFVVVCPETGKEEARLIAERVRRAVAETSFFLADSSSETTRVTVSVGFATFPLDAGIADDLIKQADAALYAAKHAGRNAVRGAEDVGTRMAA